MLHKSPHNISPPQRIKWYQDARFGLFIHWGAYSAAGVEASWSIMEPDLAEAMFKTQSRITEHEYTRLPARFNPLGFNAGEWVQLAKEAGMRYIVFTSKHHDGFCMFDAPGTDYKITTTPFGRDVCLELAQACAKADMPLGFYYSPPDMHHPGYRDTRRPVTRNWTGEPKRKQWGDYLDYMESHIRKLLTDYGKVSVIWFDGLANHGKYDPQRFHRLIHELSPDTLINDRLGDDFDFVTPEQFIPRSGIPARTGKPPAGLDPGGDGFFRLVSSMIKVPVFNGLIRRQMQRYASGSLELTPVYQEQFPSPERFQPWETCLTMGQSWAYNPQETSWKEPGTLVKYLVQVAARGGNYLLNVGPTSSGRFPPEAIDRLNHVGRWMELYGETIYGSTYTSLQGQPWGQATRKNNKIFLHIANWSTSGRLVIDPFPGRALAVHIYEGNPLTFDQKGSQLEIEVPAQSPDPDISVLAVEIDGSEKCWSDYSRPATKTHTPWRYIKSQAITSAWFNAILNALIAYFSYRNRTNIPFAEAAVDILITVFIIVFLTAWLVVGSARKEFARGNLTRQPTMKRGLILPRSAVLRALIISLPVVILFAGLILDGSIFLITPDGSAGWAYILFKIIYTGATGALASMLTILSVVADENRK